MTSDALALLPSPSGCFKTFFQKCFKVAPHCTTFFSAALSFYEVPKPPLPAAHSCFPSTPPLVPAPLSAVLYSRLVARCVLKPVSFGTEKECMQLHPQSRWYYMEKASPTNFSHLFLRRDSVGCFFPCCILKKGISGKRFKSHCLQSSLVVFCFQYSPVLLYCSATPGISQFLQLHQYESVGQQFPYIYVYTHTENAHQLGNLISVSLVKICFCCMWVYYAHRKSTAAVDLRSF